MSLLRDSLTTFSARGTSFLVGVGASIIATRNLIPADKGAYSYITLFYSVMLLLGRVGVDMATVYYVGKKKHSLSEVAATLLAWGILSGLASVGAVVGFFLVFREALFQGLGAFYFFLFLSFLPFSMLDSSFGGILTGKGLFIKCNLWIAATSLFGLACLIVAVYVLRGGLLGVMTAKITEIVIRSVGFVFLVRREVKFQAFGFKGAILRDFLSFGSKGYVAGIMTFLNHRLDMFLVKRYLGLDQLAFYSLAVSIAELVWHISDSVAVVLFTRVSSSGTEEADRITAKACRHTLFLSLWPVLFMLALSGLLIPLVYTETYSPAVMPLIALLPGVLMLGLNKVISSNLNGRGRPIIPTYASGVSVIANVLLNLFFIPRWGIVGAALASNVSYTVAMAINLSAFLGYSKVRLRDVLIIKPRDFELYGSLLYKSFLKGKLYIWKSVQKKY
jgi:O-antigen/teichoic acid export membrane protein